MTPKVSVSGVNGKDQLQKLRITNQRTPVESVNAQSDNNESNNALR